MLILNDSADFESRTRHLLKITIPRQNSNQKPQPRAKKSLQKPGLPGGGGIVTGQCDTCIICRQLGLLKLEKVILRFLAQNIERQQS